MAEYDLSGYGDCDSAFTEIAVDTEEHLAQTLYRALSTRRGTDAETLEGQGRWADIVDFVQTRADGRLNGILATIANDLVEADDRVLRAEIKGELVGDVVAYKATLITRSGTVTAEGTRAPFPPSTEAPDLPLGPAGDGLSFRSMMLEPGPNPSYLTGPNCGRILWSIGMVFDLAIEWLLLGIQQRFPDYCEEEALPWLCRDRGIRRGQFESSASLRARLIGWLQTARRIGNPFAILRAVRDYFAPARPLVRTVEHDPTGATRATWCTLHPDDREQVQRISPSDFDWDSQAADYDQINIHKRFFVIVYQDPDVESEPLYAEDQTTEGSAAPLTTGSTTGLVGFGVDMYRMCADHKSAGSWCGGLIITFDSTSFLPGNQGLDAPDGTWHRYADDAGYPHRFRDARYIEYKRRPETTNG